MNNANSQVPLDILYLQRGPDGVTSEPQTFLGTATRESVPTLSPDGRFLAYVSNESGRGEIYIRPFPEGAGKWQGSVNGSTKPRWRSDGSEFYYVERQTWLMTVAVSAEQGLTLGQPQRLFESSDPIFDPLTPDYDVSADGQRFLMTAPVGDGDEEAPRQIRVVLNWYE